MENIEPEIPKKFRPIIGAVLVGFFAGICVVIILDKKTKEVDGDKPVDRGPVTPPRDSDNADGGPSVDAQEAQSPETTVTVDHPNVELD
jgi:hypothetical protein